MGTCSCCSYEQNTHKDFIRGGVDESDFADEFRVVNLKNKTKKSRPRSATRTPCSATENGRHVYVWEPYEWRPGKERVFYRYFGYHKYEQQVCCGCLTTKGWRRETEQYLKVKERKWRKVTGGEFGVKRGEPVQRWRRFKDTFYNFVWEDNDDGYLRALAAWETTQEAISLHRQAELRRIEFRHRLLGYN